MPFRDWCESNMKNGGFSFRIRGRMPKRSGIATDQWRVRISSDGVDPPVWLTSENSDVSLADSENVVVRSDGYPSEEEARAMALDYRGVLIRAFARCRLAVDFGDRAHKSHFTEAGLRTLEEKSGRRVLNNTHGVMIFPSEPRPLLVGGKGGGIRTPVKAVRLVREIEDVFRGEGPASGREQLAYDLFSASFGSVTDDARFLNLMMAVETLIEQAERPDRVQAHVEQLIRLTMTDSGLDQGERDSLLGALRRLGRESIGQAGARLAARLGDKKYREMEAPQFFKSCYELRSKLVHGVYPRPTREEVGRAAASLEIFVSDLLGGTTLPADA